jgi:hypothetical protein
MSQGGSGDFLGRLPLGEKGFNVLVAVAFCDLG